jgi:UDP-N-acetylglucosamine 2-epimerase (non-hydrolysing)
MKRIGVFLGTRPELIKCQPLFASNPAYIPIFVEQHKDLISSAGSHSIQVIDSGPNRLNNIVSSILNSVVWTSVSLDAVLVQGDTAVAFAAAVAAFHKGIPIIHLEAGLRTYNNDHPWPEEGYRRMIDAIASIALCPSEDSATNLRAERFTGQISVVGNTSIDAINAYGLIPAVGNIVVVTLHRRENWDQIPAFFEAIETLAVRHPELSFILPIHPNPRIAAHSNLLQHVKVVEPMPHAVMCGLLASSNCIISDSGGIQEEAAWLGKRVFCCRIVTERTELVNHNLTFTPTPADLLERFHPQTELLSSATCYGNGDSVARINAVLFSTKEETPA